jgi:hypothetical protein
VPTDQGDVERGRYQRLLLCPRDDIEQKFDHFFVGEVPCNALTQLLAEVPWRSHERVGEAQGDLVAILTGPRSSVHLL